MEWIVIGRIRITERGQALRTERRYFTFFYLQKSMKFNKITREMRGTLERFCLNSGGD